MNKFRMTTGTVTLFLVLLSLCGCGKKGVLIAPEALVPAAVADLSLAQKGPYFQVSWSAPTKEEGGARLKDLAGFILFRRVMLPANLDCDTCPGAYSERTRVDLNYQQETRKIGSRFYFDDYDLKKGESYQYKIGVLSADGSQSRDSNRAHRTAVTPPLPPVLEATSSNTGISLNFVAIPPEEGKLVGYNVYRAKTGQPMPLAPLNSAPVSANTYQDTALLLGSQYSYSVRTVATMPNGEAVESAPSNFADGALVQPD